jgi:hypothetical protein
MSVRDALRLNHDVIHHGYGVTRSQRVRLYLMLKAYPNYLDLVSKERGEWLAGLEKYGDKEGWLHEEAAKRAAQVASRAGIPEQEV